MRSTDDAEREAGLDAWSLFEFAETHEIAAQAQGKSNLPFDLNEIQEVVLFFSGGKDSVACALHLLDCGVPADRIELHHHLVDGQEGQRLMDWPVTEAYCRAFAKAFGMRYETSWRQGGFEREMLRENCGTAPVVIPIHGEGRLVTGGERSKPSTRRRFPQVTANLQQRWCSSSIKIEVGSRYLNTDPRFADGKRRLVVTGERAEESAARANYQVFEPHRCDLRDGLRYQRWLDHWRPVHSWTEAQVWAILERYRVQPHAVYEVGLSRASCAYCVFGGPDQWATLRRIDRPGFDRISGFEGEFGTTIHRSRTVHESADLGTPLVEPDDYWAQVLMSTEWTVPIRVPHGKWRLPKGAFRDSGGPS